MAGLSQVGVSRVSPLGAVNTTGSFSANTWYDMNLARSNMFVTGDSDDGVGGIGTINYVRMMVIVVHMNLYGSGNPTMYNSNAVSEPFSTSGTSNSVSGSEMYFGAFVGHAPNTAQRGDMSNFIQCRVLHVYGSSGANPKFQWRCNAGLTLNGTTGGQRMSFMIHRI